MNKSKASQIRKAGGLKQYGQEMSRRQSLRKSHGHGIKAANYGGAEGLKQEMSRRVKLRWAKYYAKQQKAAEGQNQPEGQDPAKSQG